MEQEVNQLVGIKDVIELLERPNDSIVKYRKEIDDFKSSLRQINVVIHEEIKNVKI